MTALPFSAIVLAAGQGTRMRSALPKVLHPLAGFPLLWHVLKSLQALQPASVTLVTAPEMAPVRDYASAVLPSVRHAVQQEARGTGHAVLAAGDAAEAGEQARLIVFGDTPLIRPATLQRLLEMLKTVDLAVLAMRADTGKPYGRLLTGPDGALEAIREYKEASEAERALPLCNSGVVAVKGGHLFDLVAQIKNDNAKGEYYLTDIVAIARAQGLRCGFIEAAEAELLGINSRRELAQAEAAMQQRLRAQAMESGVTLLDPSSVYLSADTRFGSDIVIEPQVFIGPGVTIGNEVRLRAFSHLEGATIGDRAVVGPFARLRPGTELGRDVHIGNFVEVKNSRLGEEAKANHLSYLGDATIGARSNIGAGTITCNFDGIAKHRTVIGEDVFVGSNTALIAPLTIGDGALIGAGSTITRDIAAGALALTRPALTEQPGGAARYPALPAKK